MKRSELTGRILKWNVNTPWWIHAACDAFLADRYHFIERGPGDIYLARFWLGLPAPETGPLTTDERITSANSGLLHWILEPDIDEHCHDHPWEFTTTILSGGYTEEMEQGYCDTLVVGHTLHRGCSHTHRIVAVEPNTWTLVTTGERVQDWGFVIDGRKIPHATYLERYHAPKNGTRQPDLLSASEAPGFDHRSRDDD